MIYNPLLEWSNLMLEQDLNLTSANNIVSNYEKELLSKIGNVTIQFKNMVVKYDTQYVEWSGTLDGDVQWRFLFAQQQSGCYIATQGIKLSKENLQAMIVLQQYYTNVWFADTQQNLKNKTY